MLISLVGGIGLFLLGIHLLTEGIRSVSADSLRMALGRFASTKLRAVLSGFSITAVIQSANATIIMTMAFVGAGLLALPLAIAVIIGANIGTTSTAWLVAVLGLRFSLIPAAMVAILAGAVLRFLALGRSAAFGTALAGFGLLLLGIDFMRDGMLGAAPALQAIVPGDGVFGVLALIIIGIVATAAAQSSSVAITATMTALAVGGVDLEQAALLTIGHNLGTLATSFLAALGAGAGGRRAAIAHAVFNGSAAVASLLLLGPLLIASRIVAAWLNGGDAFALAAFHTMFNIAGSVILLPATDLLARRVSAWVPEKGAQLARHLEPLSSQLPAAALEATRLALVDVTIEAIGVLNSRIQHGALTRGTRRRLEGAEVATGRIGEFLSTLDASRGRGSPEYQKAVRALDHLEGLLEDCRTAALHARPFEEARLMPPTTRLREGLEAALAWLRGGKPEDVETAQTSLAAVPDLAASLRREVLTLTTMGDLDLLKGMEQLDALHWLAQTTTHVDRILHHLQAGSE